MEWRQAGFCDALRSICPTLKEYHYRVTGKCLTTILIEIDKASNDGGYNDHQERIVKLV